ncbi:RNA polymerase sigma factor [Tautonia plasticadhaerens]|uniref:RNA polymerase sigma factor SigX n=1 Tax=Tautonia plasticadhaerens TaxID=2527974 RepID=A0A518HC46_9BACT|nr:sigma-70 family RNA polymerase sigma factor [Tautonia plasticadhaerens]QDV38425.1 RNA polymerase sigma factor SigX [Tautonia plasticadhaerens]
MGEAGDRDWVAELREGGPATDRALEELRVLFLSGLRRALSGRAAADGALIDDLAQEATLRVLDRLDSFRGESRFTTWATAIAVRVAMTELRRARWRDVSLGGMAPGAFPVGLEPVDREPEPERMAVRAEILDLLRRTLDAELTDRQRTALVSELQGLPPEEIARGLGINRNALYKLVHDARKKLKARLIDAGLSDDDVRYGFGMPSE